MTPHASIPVEQYDALRRGRGVVELAGWLSVSVSGGDRQSFLHNFCTNDVKRLGPGTSCEAFFTNVKGKIVGHGLITCREEELVLVGVPEQAPRLIEHLDRYILREDVALRDTTKERAYALVAGDAARDVVGEWSSNLAERWPGTQPLPHAGVHIRGVSARAIAWDLNAPHFACVLEVAVGDSARLLRALAKLGFLRCGPEALLARRVEAGIPLFGVDFDDRHLPQEVGRDAEAISFTKGCYLGQETVARIDAVGHVNRRLVGVRFFGDQVPAAGSELLRGGGKVGELTSATFSPQLGVPLGLAMVRREANAAGSRLESDCGEGEVASLPLGGRQDASGR